jgi:hypothetical protein
VGDDRHYVLRQKLLGEDGSVRRGVVMATQPGLFSPKFGATSSHVFTQLPQNFAVEPGIHILACWDKFFVQPQLLYRWRHQSGILWIPPRTSGCWRRRWWLLEDGATCSCHVTLMQCLTALYPGCNIVLNGDIGWPPRSPDYFLWGHLKAKMYAKIWYARTAEGARRG